MAIYLGVKAAGTAAAIYGAEVAAAEVAAAGAAATGKAAIIKMLTAPVLAAGTAIAGAVACGKLFLLLADYAKWFNEVQSECEKKLKSAQDELKEMERKVKMCERFENLAQ